ncbi:MAG: zf-HC2 domain-containing protein, partial [Nitrospinae bacterium]|nr:zf-HC2 domain-containing protein [Nitrospinota bacterium]
MDKCSEIKRYLYPYIDGELGTKETLLVYGHLEGCPECKKIVEKERTFLAKIKNLKISNPPPNLEEKIKEGIDKRDTSIPHRRSFIAAGFILFIFIAGGAIFYLLNNKKSLPDIASASVMEHLSYLRGSLPLDITDSNPEEISRWFRGKIDFNLALPMIDNKEII